MLLIYHQRRCWALSVDLPTCWLTKGHTLGRGRVAALIYRQRSCWSLSIIDLPTGWLRKGHTLGRGRARLVALTHLLTEKKLVVLSIIDLQTGWFTKGQMIFCSLTESIPAWICLDNCVTMNYDLSEVDYMSVWLQFSTVFGELVECISKISCSSSTLHKKKKWQNKWFPQMKDILEMTAFHTDNIVLLAVCQY